MRHIATLKLVSDSDEELESDVFLPNQPDDNLAKVEKTLSSPYTDAAVLVGKILVAACVCCALYSIIRHDSSTSAMGDIDDYLP